jgi:SAM-dependent methyltransferase
MKDNRLKIREAYHLISDSYQSKKSDIWLELLNDKPDLKSNKSGLLLDLGGGNGRNTKYTLRTLIVTFDLAISLLEKSVNNSEQQKVAGSLPSTPFRRQCADEIISIAVLHHFETQSLRQNVMKEYYNLCSDNGSVTITVWRKWRPENAKKIIEAIRKKQVFTSFIDHQRPWKDSSGNILTYRFYHYYTRKELIQEINQANFKHFKIKLMGGKSKQDNFIVYLKKTKN